MHTVAWQRTRWSRKLSAHKRTEMQMRLNPCHPSKGLVRAFRNADDIQDNWEERKRPRWFKTRTPGKRARQRNLLALRTRLPLLPCPLLTNETTYHPPEGITFCSSDYFHRFHQSLFHASVLRKILISQVFKSRPSSFSRTVPLFMRIRVMVARSRDAPTENGERGLRLSVLCFFRRTSFPPFHLRRPSVENANKRRFFWIFSFFFHHRY